MSMHSNFVEKLKLIIEKIKVKLIQCIHESLDCIRIFSYDHTI